MRERQATCSAVSVISIEEEKERGGGAPPAPAASAAAAAGGGGGKKPQKFQNIYSVMKWNEVYAFSALWLRSSVVSVLISLTTGSHLRVTLSFNVSRAAHRACSAQTHGPRAAPQLGPCTLFAAAGRGRAPGAGRGARGKAVGDGLHRPPPVTASFFFWRRSRARASVRRLWAEQGTRGSTGSCPGVFRPGAARPRRQAPDQRCCGLQERATRACMRGARARGVRAQIRRQRARGG
jgi:hypothetical protein